MKKLQKDQRGLSQVALVGLIVLVVGAIGFVGWRITQKSSDQDNSHQEALKQAAQNCDLDDKDICKFLTSWKQSEHYTVTAKSTVDGEETSFTFQTAGEDRSRMTSTGEHGFEMITIGQTVYTKDPGDGKWWKQTITDTEQTANTPEDMWQFSDPSDDINTEEAKQTYQKEGKEACGDLQCFKYQIIDPNMRDEKQFIWFDDRDYQLRRMTTEGPDGSSEMTFAYDRITIDEPKDVKELGPNQVIVPGSSEPMTMPSAEEMQR